MELHMHSHHWESRAPDWSAAAVSGFAAGAAIMVVEFFWSTMILNISPWAASHLVAAILMGPDALQSTGYSFGVVFAALAIHYVLGVIFSVILASIIAPFHLDSSMGMVMLAGAVFGLALYLVNFYGMIRFFPWFADMRNLVTLASHILFGITAAGMYRYLERR
ncbi:hypothetical protein LPB67_11945 [Undibacterium sp. Jales W-56]|uniref:hypothetical protein n=1 Tax=Undibacterium sp. Jales W-56 TaxID=2897325 RepID=UPI0021D2F749|nr:hypothetical protein [Undibacterium sp. Jales W-56]MCU6434483.1 hypothetical protein [Undibacterium sp. Jales W-56]